MIYKSVKSDLPTLSKTTVYNVLDLLVRHNIIVPVHLDSAESRFEMIGYQHSHFKCKECGAIYDIPQIDLDLSGSGLQGFKVESKEVLLKGVCDKCNKE